MASLLGIASLVCLLYAADFTRKLGGDYSFYFSNGWFLQHGLHPYVDFWTHKPPLLVMALAAWIGLFGSSFYSAVTFMIVVTILCAYCVTGLATAMRLGSGVSYLSGGLFALTASSHWLDPDRHGLIIVFASIFELLSVVLVLRGLKRNSYRLFFVSGVLIAMAIASRQTSLPVYLVLIGTILIHNGSDAIRRSLLQGLAATLGCIFAGTLFLAYLLANGADLLLLSDQLSYFNIAYASQAWSYSSVMDWLHFWLRISAGGFLLFVVACLAYFSADFARGLGKNRGPRINSGILLMLLLAHSASILLASWESPYYGMQLFPEASIVAAIVIVSVSPRRDSFKISRGSGGLRPWFALATLAVLLAIPIGREVKYSYTHIRDAVAGGYLTDISKLPWYRDEAKAAAEIDAMAPNKNDQVWLLQYGHDMVYINSNRLPAIMFTQSAGLTQPNYSGDTVFSQWYSQFLAERPTVVVFFPWVDTSSTPALQRIRAVIESSMQKVDSGDTDFEVFAWK